MTDHEVDAGAVAFVFDLPEPTVARHRSRDAGAVAFAFDLPELTATKRLASVASLLPVNSTLLERALEASIRPNIGPDAIRQVWNAWRCPAKLLPWLAWALSVDYWDDEWTEKEKRAVIAASIDVHRRKGTVSAMRRAVEALGFSFQIVEWWETTPRGTPGTAEVYLGRPHAPFFAQPEIDFLMALLDEAKRATLHLTLSQAFVENVSLYDYARWDVWESQAQTFQTI